MKLIVLGLLTCVVLFVLGVFAPKRSVRAQRWVSTKLRKAERNADESAGKAGDAARTSLEKTRGATNKSARAGRKVHRRGEEAVGSIRERLPVPGRGDDG